MSGERELDLATQALVRLAAAIATGNEALVRERARMAVDVAVPPIWVDELVLQSILMVGYPRALIAAGIWRSVSSAVSSFEDGTEYARWPEWRARGEATCRTIYGENYEKLRINVARLHPAIDAWMVTEGYGRTLSRPGLDLLRRELAVVAQVAVLGAERQLHSHLRGALNAGGEAAVVEAALVLALEDAGADETKMARTLWQRIRS